MGCEGRPAAREEDEERVRIKALTPLALFKPGVINDKTHRAAQSTPADPSEPAAKTAAPGLWCGHFPNASD